MRPSVERLVRYTVAVVLVGLGAASFAVLFRTAINAVFTHLYGARDVLTAFQRLAWPWRLAVPAVGGLLAGAMGVVASRFKGGKGVGEVMEAVVLGGRHISLRLALSKALGSWFAIVSGGSIGREGPIIQLGGGIGGALGPLFGLDERESRGLVAAGTAAGFAAAYNTPLAAVLFVVEIVAGLVALELVLPAIIATAIATAVTRIAAGGGPIYGQRAFTVSTDLELLAHALLGLLAGFIGPGFMALLDRGEALFARVPVSKPLRAAAGGLAVGALSIVLPEVTGNGYEAINLVLGGHVTIALSLSLIVAKALATTASVSSGSPGGVFTPSLFIGSALGSALGQALVLAAAPHAVGAAGGYALVGMAAMIAATTHAPLLGAVMVFELSGDYAIVLPLLVATATATLVSRRLRSISIYMEELARSGRGWEITLEGRRMNEGEGRAPP